MGDEREREGKRWEVGQYKCLGLRDAGSAVNTRTHPHTHTFCSKVPLFSDMDMSTTSWAEGRAWGLGVVEV